MIVFSLNRSSNFLSDIKTTTTTTQLNLSFPIVAFNVLMYLCCLFFFSFLNLVIICFYQLLIFPCSKTLASKVDETIKK